MGGVAAGARASWRVLGAACACAVAVVEVAFDLNDVQMSARLRTFCGYQKHLRALPTVCPLLAPDPRQLCENRREIPTAAAMISAVSYATTGYTCAASYPAGPAADHA